MMHPTRLWLVTDLPWLPAGTPGEGYINGTKAAFRPVTGGTYNIPAVYVTDVEPPKADRITERVFSRVDL